jgi:hypothetical protein
VPILTSWLARTAARISGSIGSACPYAGQDVNSTLAMPTNLTSPPAVVQPQNNQVTWNVERRQTIC